ncbi:MAG: cysteine desulfurase family protein [Chloroflexi bacterium]|nr:cysteine desulfurase family protein [Chloroflexota bacterium]
MSTPPGGPLYLDSAASTPLRPEALEAMLPYLREGAANPSALHAGGRRAHEGLERAREQVAAVLGAQPEEVVFTSGGTESINAALKGVAFAQRDAGAGAHLVTTEVEHHAVLHSMHYLERFGFEVEYVPVDGEGRVDPEAVAAAIRPDTVLASVMYANNEVGTIEPIALVAEAVRERADAFDRRIPLHTDAVQAASSLPLDVDALGVDVLSLSGHKFGALKGTGILYLRRDVPFLEQISGGGQERQRRSGTENVAGAVALATALSLAQAERERFARTTRALRDRLLDGLLAACPDARLNGPREQRLPHNLHLCFPGVEGEAVVRALDERGVECSAGAACTSTTWEPSHVLLAMAVPLELAIGSVRLTLSPEVTVEQIDYVVRELPAIVRRLREEGGSLLPSTPAGAIATAEPPARS